MSPERNSTRVSFEDIVTNAKEIVLQNGYHVPILIIEGNKHSLAHHFSEMPETHGERLDLMRHLGQSAAKAGQAGKLLQVFLISEGWMSMASDEKQANMRPSQDPDRKEVLIVSGLEKEHQIKYLRVFEMIRDLENKVIELEEIVADRKPDFSAEVPLLDAFVQGFLQTFQARVN